MAKTITLEGDRRVGEKPTPEEVDAVLRGMFDDEDTPKMTDGEAKAIIARQRARETVRKAG